MRWPSRTGLELALRAGLGAGFALWFDAAIGLTDPYWGAISAVVATAGTLGASLAVAFQRVAATLIALAIGVGFAALPVHGAVVAGLAVGVTFAFMFAIKLEAGARLAGATTLIVTAIPGNPPVHLALSRGLNVPVGCIIAVFVGLVVFPHRATKELADHLVADQRRALDLAADALACFLGTPVSDLEARSDVLGRDVDVRRATLRDAAREPGRSERQRALERRFEQTALLVAETTKLVEPAVAGTSDAASSLVRPQLEVIEQSLRTWPTPALGPAMDALDQGFDDARAQRATVDYSTAEITRLLQVMRRLHGIASVLALVAIDGEAVSSTPDTGS